MAASDVRERRRLHCNLTLFWRIVKMTYEWLLAMTMLCRCFDHLLCAGIIPKESQNHSFLNQWTSFYCNVDIHLTLMILNMARNGRVRWITIVFIVFPLLKKEDLVPLLLEFTMYLQLGCSDYPVDLNRFRSVVLCPRYCFHRWPVMEKGINFSCTVVNSRSSPPCAVAFWAVSAFCLFLGCASWRFRCMSQSQQVLWTCLAWLCWLLWRIARDVPFHH